MTDRHALVHGATGFIGRNVVLALNQAGVRVSVVTRSPESYGRLAAWLADHGQPAPARAQDETVTEVYNCAGAYRFGMSAAEARHANVDSVRALAESAAELPKLQRLVHVSGYRVGGQDPVLWSEERRRRTYRALGAYEASKAEADAVFQVTASELGVPWTIVNPSSVIGATDQDLGLATTVKDLLTGNLPALPGNAKTFVPIVDATYLAEFMALLPTDESTKDQSYWVLDDGTPPLPDLLALIADHYQVKVPRLRIPVGLLKLLPHRITKAEPETLTFLSTDRYPTATAKAFAATHNLTMPDTTKTILAWAESLVGGSAAAHEG